MSARGGRGGYDGAETVGLAEVIGRIREELEEARRGGRDSGLQFRVERVHVEFLVQVRREGTGKGGLNIGVVTAEAGATAAHESMHRIEIELMPHDRDDPPEGPGFRVGGPR
ncbi:trypco2 family protein [Streptomyces sp. NBC_01716]|uniref:trypco2 family protein n=1 Tax=Streptomyces sp. NBC_01716 TaxID=2975917 RepID=UPI002E37168F|nr:trypco2 family protein [Streptomyces sp. NBC_01716]